MPSISRTPIWLAIVSEKHHGHLSHVFICGKAHSRHSRRLSELEIRVQFGRSLANCGFLKRNDTMTNATAKLRIRAVQRWMTFCEEAGCNPLPIQPHWMAVFLTDVGEKGATVAATTATQLKVWCEWLSVNFPDQDSFINAAVVSSANPREIQQAQPLELFIVVFGFDVFLTIETSWPGQPVYGCC